MIFLSLPPASPLHPLCPVLKLVTRKRQMACFSGQKATFAVALLLSWRLFFYVCGFFYLTLESEVLNSVLLLEYLSWYNASKTLCFSFLLSTVK